VLVSWGRAQHQPALGIPAAREAGAVERQNKRYGKSAIGISVLKLKAEEEVAFP